MNPLRQNIPCRQPLRLVDQDGQSWRRSRPLISDFQSSYWHCLYSHRKIMVPLGDERPIEVGTPLLVWLGVSLLNLLPDYLLPLGIREHPRQMAHQ